MPKGLLSIWFGSKLVNLFKQDVIDLFSGKRGGHVEHWLYSDTIRNEYSGSQLWQEFLKSSTDYYVLKNEIDLIARVAPSLGAVLPNMHTVIDFGVGSGQALEKKVMPIVDSLKTVKSYIGVDLSGDFLRNAKNTLADNFPSVEAAAIQADFFNTSFALPQKDTLGVMLGCTISNMDVLMGADFPRSHIVKRLSHLKGLLGSNNHLLVSYDANTDVESILSAYSNEYWGRHVTGIMYDVAKISEGNFSAADWRHLRVWNDTAYVLHQCAEATQDMEFSIDDKVFTVSKGEQFVTVNNFKFPKPLFQSMCDEVGFVLKDSYSDNQGRMQLQLLKS